MKILGFKIENHKRIGLVEMTLTNKGLIIIAGKNGQGKCIPEGTPISLWDGTRKSIEDIRETDSLIGLSQHTWAFQEECPKRLFTNGVREVFEVRTERGHVIAATAGHRLLSPSGWNEIHNLSVGDYLAVPMRLPGRKESPMSDEEALLIGLILGDGCLTERFGFTCGNEDVGLLFAKACKKLFPDVIIHRYTKPDCNAWTFQLSAGKKGKLRPPHLDWLEANKLRGTNSYTKFLPEDVYKGETSVKWALAGLMMTDGHVYSDGYAWHYSRSEELALAVRRLMLRLEIPTSIRVRVIREKPFYNTAVVSEIGRKNFIEKVLPLLPSSRVKIGNHAASGSCPSYSIPPFVVKLFDEAGLPGVRPWIRGHATMSRGRLMRFCDTLEHIPEHLQKHISEDIGWDPILSIRSLGEMQTFDLEMPSQAFLANDFIVHNSSLLDGIEDALKGGTGDSRPVRKGEEKSRNTVELGDKPPADFIVTRTRTENGNMSLVVKDKDGNKQESPQALLDKLYGALSFDPLHFVSQKPAERAETLRKLLGLDFKTEDEEIAKHFEERTIVNREVKAIEARAKVLTEFPDVPAEEQSAAAIIEEQTKAIAHNDNNRRFRDKVMAAKRDAVVSADKSTRAQNETARIHSEIEKLQALLKRSEETWKAALAETETKLQTVKEFEAEASGLQDIDITPFATQLRELEGTNQKVRANKSKAELRTQYKAKSKVAEDLSTKIERLEKQKRKHIAEAKFPVEGLSLSDTTKEVLFNGIPFDQASTAEQLKVSVAMGLAMNPKLRLLLIRQGNDLDVDNLKLVAEMAEKADAQVLCERVDEGGATVVIEDGMVKGAA